MQVPQLLRGSEAGLWESVWRLKPGELIGIKLGLLLIPVQTSEAFLPGASALSWPSRMIFPPFVAVSK